MIESMLCFDRLPLFSPPPSHSIGVWVFRYVIRAPSTHIQNRRNSFYRHILYVFGVDRNVFV